MCGGNGGHGPKQRSLDSISRFGDSDGRRDARRQEEALAATACQTPRRTYRLVLHSVVVVRKLPWLVVCLCVGGKGWALAKCGRHHRRHLGLPSPAPFPPRTRLFRHSLHSHPTTSPLSPPPQVLERAPAWPRPPGRAFQKASSRQAVRVSPSRCSKIKFPCWASLAPHHPSP